MRIFDFLGQSFSLAFFAFPWVMVVLATVSDADWSHNPATDHPVFAAYSTILDILFLPVFKLTGSKALTGILGVVVGPLIPAMLFYGIRGTPLFQWLAERMFGSTIELRFDRDRLRVRRDRSTGTSIPISSDTLVVVTPHNGTAGEIRGNRKRDPEKAKDEFRNSLVVTVFTGSMHVRVAEICDKNLSETMHKGQLLAARISEILAEFARLSVETGPQVIREPAGGGIQPVRLLGPGARVRRLEN